MLRDHLPAVPVALWAEFTGSVNNSRWERRGLGAEPAVSRTGMSNASSSYVAVPKSFRCCWTCTISDQLVRYKQTRASTANGGASLEVITSIHVTQVQQGAESDYEQGQSVERWGSDDLH